MKELFDKFGKKKVYATVIVASVVVVATIIALAMPHTNPLALKQDTFVTEYGEDISTNAKDYLKTEDKSVLEKAKVSIEKLENEKDKEYAKVGTYKAVATYNKKSIEFSIEVKDTKAPVFKDLMKEIVIEQNAEDVDFTKFFKVEDLSEVKISVNNKKVDLKTIGNYEIKVTAKDKYDNETIKVVEVKVVSMDEAEKDGVITKTLDGTVYQSKELKDKVAEEQKVQEENNNSGNNSNSGITSGAGNISGDEKPSQPSKPNVCVSDGNFGSVGNSGKVFFSKGEADKFANDFIVNQVDWVYQGYTAWTVYDNCGETTDRDDIPEVWTVNFY